MKVFSIVYILAIFVFMQNSNALSLNEKLSERSAELANVRNSVVSNSSDINVAPYCEVKCGGSRCDNTIR